MPTIVTFGGLEDEQATGPDLNSGLMHIYFVRQDDPLNMFYLGGHRFDDAPTYNISEGKIMPRYRQVGGRNIVEEEALTSDYVKSISFNLLLPNRLISISDRIYQLQDKCKWDMLMFPDNCSEGCDEFFWVFKDVRLGAKQFTATPVGFDEQEGAITTMRVVRTSGQYVEYHGMQTTTMFENADYALYGIEVVEEACNGCDCPHQLIHVVGSDISGAPAAVAPIHMVSQDGGASWTVNTGGAGQPLLAIQTLLGAVGTLTDVKYINGRLFITFATAYQTTGATAGGIAYSVDNGATWVLATDDAGGALATVGFHQIIKAFGKIFAFGSDGYAYRSCDNGSSFEQYSIASDLPASTEWFAADFDNRSNLIWLGGDDATVYTFDGRLWTDLTAEVNADAAADIHDIRVSRPGHILIGTSDGYLFENFDYVNGAVNAWRSTFLVTNVDAIGVDKLSYRVLAGHGNTFALRDVINEQNFLNNFSTVVGVITDIDVPTPYRDEGENDYYFVTASGVIGKVAQCFECLEGDC